MTTTNKSVNNQRMFIALSDLVIFTERYNYRLQNFWDACEELIAPSKPFQFTAVAMREQLGRLEGMEEMICVLSLPIECKLSEYLDTFEQRGLKIRNTGDASLVEQIRALNTRRDEFKANQLAKGLEKANDRMLQNFEQLKNEASTHIKQPCCGVSALTSEEQRDLGPFLKNNGYAPKS